jgi:2-iminobutanoate/2-iminopropanoate deaminase
VSQAHKQPRFSPSVSQKFGDARPARAAIEVARLPKDVSVEIECVALAE